MPKVSCLSLERRARGRGGTPHGENGRNKKSFFSATIRPLIKIGLESRRVPLYNENDGKIILNSCMEEKQERAGR